ncbi:helix-turn-helix transcriptional regulator [Leptospira licerasiae]|uniref:helix-turn-helix transcriptional regulator n=1 Tax=Leptospira licerasiae TaxID=447106 RepID=UPI001083FEFF|nr:helix-turn-helix domain-containing protein [Leptospira licerasiae]TGM88504.1 helix-turn-helix domain-containing protein [Leptospira licerasiae]
MNAVSEKPSRIKLSSHVRKMFYSTKEFARLLGKSEKTIHRWEESGVFPFSSYELGERSTVWLISDVENWINSRRNKKERT